MPVQQAPLPFFDLLKGAPFAARFPRIIPRIMAGAIPTFTEFYIQNNGDNRNSGSDSNASPKYSSVTGNWVSATSFTPTDGSNPVAAGVATGDYMAVMPDGAASTPYIVRISAVDNLPNGRITVNSNFSSGVVPVSSATTTVRVGGAWKGPSGAVLFPWSINTGSAFQSCTDIVGHRVRFNFKNDQTYSVSALFTISMQSIVIQGFTSTPGDGGKATLASSQTAASRCFDAANQSTAFIDMVFQYTGSASIVSDIVQSSGTNILFLRCVFRDASNYGLNQTGSGGMVFVIECEAYNCNRAQIDGGGFVNANNFAWFHQCYSHDHVAGISGKFSCAYAAFGSSSVMHMSNCIGDSCAYGIKLFGVSPYGQLIITNCDFYNMTADAILFVPLNTTGNGYNYVANCNFVLIGGKAINNLTQGSQSGGGSGGGIAAGIMYNCGRYMVAGGPDVLGSIMDGGNNFIYPSSPYRNAPAGDFSLLQTVGLNSGRSFFTQTLGGKGGTVGYPDVGAAQALGTLQGFIPSGTDTQTLPYGYVGYFYAWKWGFSQPTVGSIISGTLPPGVALVQLAPTVIGLIGTPTAIGGYDFTIRTTVGTSFGDAPFEINIFADPDQGSSFVSGI
jgi:hypothetical protein